MSERFKLFFEELMKNEGNYSCLEGDTGGETLWGISKNNFPQQFQFIYGLWSKGKKELAKDCAMKFYCKEFYNPLYDLIEDSSLAFRIFDFGVNSGKGNAVKLLTRTINKYYMESKDSLKEVNFLNFVEPKALPKDFKRVEGETILYALYIYELDKWYRSLKQFFRFGRGWLNRLGRVFNGAPDLYKPLSSNVRYQTGNN